MVNLSARKKHTLTFNCNNTRQDKAKTGKALRHVEMMGKTHKRAGTQARKAYQ